MRRRLLAGCALAMVLPTLSSASETINYSYDARGRLVQVAHSGTVNDGVTTSYVYDKAHNRVSKTTSTGAGGGGAGVTFSIASNGAVTEGTNSIFTVTKAGTATGSLSVNYGTADGTAAAPGDYTATFGTLTFLPSESSKQVSVPTVDDSGIESAESFSMALSSPSTGASLGSPSSAAATINDNDTSSVVSFAISDAAASEGDSLQFTVTRSGPTSGSYTVNYASANGTAGSLDYTATSGTLTFASGLTTLTISVPTRLDSLSGESDETMFMNLSAASGGATIADAQGVGTIFNVDAGCQDPRTC